MSLGNKVPVYLVNGFLESGKTAFIQETLSDPYFSDGGKTLLIACEEGEERSTTCTFWNPMIPSWCRWRTRRSSRRNFWRNAGRNTSPPR